MFEILLSVAAIVAAQNPQSDTSAAPAAAIKTCPDGSTILRTQTCATPLPDHRYLYAVDPLSATLTTQWRCQDEKSATEVRIRITEKPFIDAAGDLLRRARFDVQLVSMRVVGNAPSSAAKERVQTALESFNEVSNLAGRCLREPAGGMRPVLSIHGFDEDGKAVTHTDISLR